MTEASRHDAWTAGDRYEAYMGRWSRQLAPRFLEWLGVAHGLDWMDVGCGTGALSSAILAQCNPKSLVAVDPSDGFVATARATIKDPRADFQVGNAQALPLPDAGRDVVVSGLVLNFVPDMPEALGEMRRVTRSGGTVGFYVWDYPSGGVEFMHAFWAAAVALDPAARELAEDKRFPSCTAEGMTKLARESGLAAIDSRAIEIATVFRDFDDYWHPFTLGAGPAPGYCVSLNPERRQRLKDSLHANLPRNADGSIPLMARAWAIKAHVT